NLPSFLQLYQSYAQDAARNGLSPERFLLALCEAEVAEREAKRIGTAIRRAKFPFLKEITDYDFSELENISKTTFLELAQGGYMSRAENLILVGNPGLGKTHLAIGLALAACRQGKRVRFYKTAALINDLQVAQKKLNLSGFMARFTRLDLLVLDELGFIAVDKAGGQLLFQLVSELYEQVSMIITSNLRFGDWNSIFADATLTTAFLDRLTHKGRILEFMGESYRYRHRLHQEEQSTSTSV
ncbi:IS21-like element helper ATPase IstB, partial [Dictyobacter arantiisoli]|uniref:IS21-like element helper ATPase IstB n=1 Tax=Dictyobacter arantiisoli TaxID=2014874 RepID=UPI0011EC7645